jgi:hypothetical protein
MLRMFFHLMFNFPQVHLVIDFRIMQLAGLPVDEFAKPVSYGSYIKKFSVRYFFRQASNNVTIPLYYIHFTLLNVVRHEGFEPLNYTLGAQPHFLQVAR